MRVTAGSCRGMRLRACEGKGVARPTLDGVKQRIFNAVSARLDFSGLHVLDLFAGSGALGIEALSRGAEACTFVDVNSEAISVINENLVHTGMGDRAKVVKSDFLAILECGTSWDLIFVDAPYNTGLMNQAVIAIERFGNLAERGLIVVEHGVEEIVEFGNFEEVKRYKAGSVGITLLQGGRT